MEEKQQELSRLANEIELLQSQVNAHNQNLEILAVSLSETRQTLETLEQLKKTDVGREVLIPLGTGSFVKAILKQNDRVLIGVGSGFSVDKDVDEAKAVVDMRAQQLESVIKKTREAIEEISGRLDQSVPRWQQLYKELSESQAAT